eukprot:998704_1
MSLSFVKSAVLSSTDGVSHNEETTIDNKETQSLRASGAGGGSHKPLFEQLRANKEADLEKDVEFQRSIRGTRPLDEEDCAHLDSVERMKNERDSAVKSGIERELALFRAAREHRGMDQTVVDIDGAEDVVRGDAAIAATVKVEQPAATASKQKEAKKIAPKFTIKKKRKRVSQKLDSKNNDTGKKSEKNSSEKKQNKEENDNVEAKSS